ncbi:MAG: right-handed parallel beta-helix repeat-containing protein [Candidatus Altiarchaeota archaeon]|nr:right-handed parallel beta-helix repeat-containing protein [Candidatus Altiarchaeota archaeon]
MRKSLLLSTLLVFVFLANAQAQMTYLPPVIKPPVLYSLSIVAPASGETVEGGETFRMQWTSSTNIYLVAIHYSADGGKTWKTLEDCTKNANRYSWAVPNKDVPSARVKVEGLSDCTKRQVIADDVSGPFEIEAQQSIQPPVTVPIIQPCTCNSCTSCSSMMEGSCETVYLGEDIRGMSSQCVSFTANDKTFDCEGHKIRGGAIGQEFYYGIFAKGNGITIQNCGIEEFEAGIDLHNTQNAKVMNCTITDNYAGLFIADSTGTRLEDNVIEDNTDGIYLANTNNARIEGNRICGNIEADIYTSPWHTASGSTRDDNTCDLIYNWNGDSDVTWCDNTCTADISTTVATASGFQNSLDGDYGTVELTGDVSVEDGVSVGASHVTILCNGHRISGSGSGTGISIQNKVNIELNDCVIDNFQTGVLMHAVSHSRILSNEIKNNDYGVILRGGAMPSRSDTLQENQIKPNDVYGVYLDGDVWDNIFTDNELLGSQYSLFTNAKCDNDIDDSNTAGNNRKIGYFHDASGLSIDSSYGSREFGELIICNVENSQFTGVSINNGAVKSDGVLIKDSGDVSLTVSTVSSTHQGVSITNSSDITLTQTDIDDQRENCISISQSDGVELDQGSLSNCKVGVSISFSTGNQVHDLGITDFDVAAVLLYTSSGNGLEDLAILRGSGSSSAKGIVLQEGSDGNRITDSFIKNTAGGITIDSTCENNRIEGTRACNNTNDFLNSGTGNTGDNNNCSSHGNWKDDGVTLGCDNCCSPPTRDIDEDGVDDACDCTDVLRGPNEIGVDCGGICSECIECTWCDSKVEPLRIKGRPNSGYIDMVFVPEDDWGSDWNGFVEVATNATRIKFMNMQSVASRPLYEGYEDMFNFYLYKGGKGDATTDAGYCYNPEGSEDWLCIGCKGWLPGEKDYFDWEVSCSVMCAVSLGFACWCFALEPDHFWDHASFADSVGVITKREIRGCAGFGPTSHYTAAYCGNDGNVILHETGHSLFALTDEYCGDTSYSRTGTKPNVWNSLGDCQSVAASEGWTDGNCVQIQDINASGVVTCSKDKFRYDTDVGQRDLMASGCWTGGKPTAKEADIRRINHVFENWGGGGSRGVISYIRFKDGEMRGLIPRVVPNHPDLGIWATDFVGLTQSASGGDLDKFSFGDPRLSQVGEGPGPVEGVFSEDTMFPLIVPMHENIRWLSIFNGSDGSLETTVDLGPAIWTYCNETGWEDEYCRTIDLDDNGVLDYRELDKWEPEERFENATFTDRPGMMIESIEDKGLPGSAQPQKPAGPAAEKIEPRPTEEGMNLTLFIVVLVVVVIVLGALLTLKKRPKEAKSLV